MRWIQITLSVVSVGIVFFSAQPARAQYAYVPLQTPSLSPWLNLGQYDLGPSSTYLRWVRPEKQLRETLYRQQLSIQRQNTAVRTLGTQIMQFQQEGSLRPTGTGSGFMNYSHYYQMPISTSRRR